MLAIGLGAVNDAPPNGVAPAAGWAATTIAAPSMTIGGLVAATSGAKLEPNMVGVYRISVTVPANAASSSLPVELTIAGEISNVLNLAVQ